MCIHSGSSFTLCKYQCHCPSEALGFRVRDYVNFIQFIKFHSLALIPINTYQGKFIERESMPCINSLNNQQLTLTSIFSRFLGGGTTFHNTHPNLILIGVAHIKGGL